MAGAEELKYDVNIFVRDEDEAGFKEPLVI